MIVKEILPLSPQGRAERLGLDASEFDHIKMNEVAAEAVNFIKRKDRSNLKVSIRRCS
jgi:hypothetical protein